MFFVCSSEKADYKLLLRKGLTKTHVNDYSINFYKILNYVIFGDFFKIKVFTVSHFYSCFKCSVFDFCCNLNWSFQKMVDIWQNWHNFSPLAIFTSINVSQVCFREQKLCYISTMKRIWWNVFNKYCKIYKKAPMPGSMFWRCHLYALEFYMFV